MKSSPSSRALSYAADETELLVFVFVNPLHQTRFLDKLEFVDTVLRLLGLKTLVQSGGCITSIEQIGRGGVRPTIVVSTVE